MLEKLKEDVLKASVDLIRHVLVRVTRKHKAEDTGNEHELYTGLVISRRLSGTDPLPVPTEIERHSLWNL